MNKAKLRRGVALLNAIARQEARPPEAYQGAWACGHQGNAVSQRALTRMGQLKCPVCRRKED